MRQLIQCQHITRAENGICHCFYSLVVVGLESWGFDPPLRGGTRQEKQRWERRKAGSCFAGSHLVRLAGCPAPQCPGATPASFTSLGFPVTSQFSVHSCEYPSRQEMSSCHRKQVCNPSHLDYLLLPQRPQVWHHLGQAPGKVWGMRPSSPPPAASTKHGTLRTRSCDHSAVHVAGSLINTRLS